MGHEIMEKGCTDVSRLTEGGMVAWTKRYMGELAV